MMKNRIKICGSLLCMLGLPLIAHAQTYTKTETIEYHDDTALWVLGQVKRTTTNGIETSRAEYAWKASLTKTYSFGKLQQTIGYYTSDGTVSNVVDGNNRLTILRSWMRGIPQQIEYADGNSIRAYVNNDGLIATTTDENGNKTCYGYDAMGRVNSITYPSETTPGVCDSTAWTAVTMAFQKINANEHGLPAGHWRHSRYQGNKHVNTYYDAMWRPILEEQLDYANIAGTLSQTVKRYDTSGRLAFQSYPTTNVGDFNSITQGVRTSYDALDRVTRIEQDSELGVLPTTYQYTSGFQQVVTNPRGFQTITQYQVFDSPTTSAPTGITSLAGTDTSAVEIYRDVLGNPTRISKRNGDGSLRADRFYVYDAYMQLCKRIEPETGATVMGYDGVGNLTHSWSGLALPATNSCNGDEAWQSGRLTWRRYTTRNQVDALRFSDGRGDQNITYTPDGLLDTVTTWNGLGGDGPVVNSYTYNKRRMLTGEAVQQTGWYGWGIGYGYDANGALATNTYPTGLIVNYSPNALGQAAAVTSTDGWTYASGIQYYPNGAIKQFTYGNGIVHTMTQNARQLPQRSTDSGGALDLAYSFDANANVNHIWDYVQDTGNGFYGRWMTYDGLDRLTDAGSCSFGGDCWHRFTYDALDNLKSWKLPGVKDYAEYVYTNNRLTNIKNSAGATVVGLEHDVQGNLANKNGQIYVFDYGNRLRETTSKEWYRYDGHGRRVLNWRWNESGVLSQYSLSGQLLYDENYRASGRKATEYVYLAGSLITTRARNIDTNTWTVSFQHTDALGSPVAVTNAAGAVIDRTAYEPYGAAINKPAYDGIGYTGHVMDGATGLTYMEQRYYDPAIGRFLSVDPVKANPNTGAMFNRYVYANNNPYRFKDPDGRKCTTTDGKPACTFDEFTNRKGETITREAALGGKISQVLGRGGRILRAEAGMTAKYSAAKALAAKGGEVTIKGNPALGIPDQKASGSTIVSRMETVQTRANEISNPNNVNSIASVKADLKTGGPASGPIDYWKDGSAGSDSAKTFGHEILHTIYSGVGVPNNGYANPNIDHQTPFDDAADDIK